MSDTLIERIDQEGIDQVSIRFTDLEGQWRQRTVQAERFKSLLSSKHVGLSVQGSAFAGLGEITDADLLLHPVEDRCFLDPYTAHPTLVVMAEMAEAGTGLEFERDPRSTARRTEAALSANDIATNITMETDLDFHLIERARLDVSKGCCSAEFLDGDIPGTDKSMQPLSTSVSGTHPLYPAMAVPPNDIAADIRAEMASHLSLVGIPGSGHQKGASVCVNQIELPPSPFIQACDNLQTARFIIRQVAASYGRTASFLPLPIPGVSDELSTGAGLILRFRLFDKDTPVFAGHGYADLSQACMHFIGGIMQHGRALNAFTNPSTNAYRKFRGKRETPSLFAYAAHNRSTAIRIPYASDAGSKSVEVRFADPNANPYLAASAILMAGLDGIKNKIDPGEAVDRNLYDLNPELDRDLDRCCRSLDEALDVLERDKQFLLEDDTFAEPLIEHYIQLKREEIEKVEAVPHPSELALGW